MEYANQVSCKNYLVPIFQISAQIFEFTKIISLAHRYNSYVSLTVIMIYILNYKLITITFLRLILPPCRRGCILLSGHNAGFHKFNVSDCPLAPPTPLYKHFLLWSHSLKHDNLSIKLLFIQRVAFEPREMLRHQIYLSLSLLQTSSKSLTHKL
jgi:hypothetical protein